MKKLIYILTAFILFNLGAKAQETPPAGLKSVNGQFYIYLADSSIWQNKGTPYGWHRVGKYKDYKLKSDSVLSSGYVTHGYFNSHLPSSNNILNQLDSSQTASYWINGEGIVGDTVDRTSIFGGSINFAQHTRGILSINPGQIVVIDTNNVTRMLFDFTAAIDSNFIHVDRPTVFTKIDGSGSIQSDITPTQPNDLVRLQDISGLGNSIQNQLDTVQAANYRIGGAGIAKQFQAIFDDYGTHHSNWSYKELSFGDVGSSVLFKLHSDTTGNRVTGREITFDTLRTYKPPVNAYDVVNKRSADSLYAASAGGSGYALKDSTLNLNKNLYDVPNKTTARTNLNVYSTTQTASLIAAAVAGLPSDTTQLARKTGNSSITNLNYKTNGTAGNGYAELISQSVSPSSSTGKLRLYADSLNRLSWKNSTYRRTIRSTRSRDETFTMPFRNDPTLADSTDIAAQLTVIKNSLSYPIKAAFFGNSIANISSSTLNDPITVTIANNNGTSLVSSRDGGQMSVVSNGKILPVANGGIGGQTSTQILARDAATASTTRKAITDMANLGAKVIINHLPENDIFTIHTSSTQAQINTIKNTLYANIATVFQREIGAGMWPVYVATAGHTYGSQDISNGVTAADVQIQNPIFDTVNRYVRDNICPLYGALYVDVHTSQFVILTPGSTYGNWSTSYATTLSNDGAHPNDNGAKMIAKVESDAILAAIGSLPTRQVYIGPVGAPNLFDNPTFAKSTSGLATGITVSTDAGTQTSVNTIGVYNNTPAQIFTVTPSTFDGSGVSMFHVILSIPVTGASPVTQIGLTDALQSAADIVIDDGSGGIPTGVQSYSCRMRLFYNGGASSTFAFSPLYNDGFDTNQQFLSAMIGRITTDIFQSPDVSANLTAVQFSIFVGAYTTTPFRLIVMNPTTVKIPSTDLAASYRATLTASLPVYTDAKGNLTTNTVQGTGATVQATGPTIANPTLTGTTNASTIGVTTINSNSANLFMGSQTAAVTQSASQFQLGGATNTYLRFGGGSTTGTTLSASASAANEIIGTSIYTTAASGTNPIITSLGIKPPTVTVTGGSTVTTTSTLHIDGTPTTGSNPVAVSIKGNTSGVIGIATQAAAGTYNYNLPTTAGTTGQVLTSGGGGSTAMTWSNVPVIQASANLTAQTAAGNITTFTVGASTATFNVSAYINVTAVSTDVIQAQVTYTDENSVSQTISFSTISTVTNSSYSPVTIRAKNGTVITVKSNLTVSAGSVTFDAGGTIIQN